MGAAGPRRPEPSTTSGAGAGRPGGPPCRFARRLLSAHRAPGWLSLHGSLVPRNFTGQRPEGGPLPRPQGCPPRGDGCQDPGFREGCGGPSPASGGRGPRS